jgi:hypothetical protein
MGIHRDVKEAPILISRHEDSFSNSSEKILQSAALRYERPSHRGMSLQESLVVFAALWPYSGLGAPEEFDRKIEDGFQGIFGMMLLR